MPSVAENNAWWNQAYDWHESGDEWSRPWGGTNAQWHGSLRPRLHRFLPAGQGLEIACGYGRWTQFLKDECEHLTALDLSDKCVSACQERFRDATNISYVVNDGTSLAMIDDASIDFVFSFDSLVHVDRATLDAYLAELARILTPDGVAFIHHSNLGAYPWLHRRLPRIPKLRGVLRRLRVTEFAHIRDPSVTASGVAASAERVGLQCIGQELISWLTRRTLIDCISTVARPMGRYARTNRVIRNSDFHLEAGYVAQLAGLYGSR